VEQRTAESADESLPRFGIVAAYRPVAAPDDRRLHHQGVVDECFLRIEFHVLEIEAFVFPGFRIDEIAEPDRRGNEIELAPGHAFFRKVDVLIRYSLFLEKAFRFLRVSAFFRSEYLNHRHEFIPDPFMLFTCFRTFFVECPAPFGDSDRVPASGDEPGFELIERRDRAVRSPSTTILIPNVHAWQSDN
jgi:hypothetical protein